LLVCFLSVSLIISIISTILKDKKGPEQNLDFTSIGGDLFLSLVFKYGHIHNWIFSLTITFQYQSCIFAVTQMIVAGEWLISLFIKVYRLKPAFRSVYYLNSFIIIGN
jgi:hypothetical protein